MVIYRQNLDETLARLLKPYLIPNSLLTAFLGWLWLMIETCNKIVLTISNDVADRAVAIFLVTHAPAADHVLKLNKRALAAMPFLPRPTGSGQLVS